MNTPAPRSASLPIFVVLAVALAAGLGLVAAQRWFAAPPAGPTAPSLQNGLSYPSPRELPPFSLDLADGASLSQDSLRGRWTLLFIGFTHCPDVCPTTLAQLAAAAKLWSDLGPDQRPRILFVSVDPERDTPASTADYARYFSPDAIGATADHGRLEPFTRSLGMVYMQSPLGDGSYSVDHTASVAVLDAEVRLVAQLRPPLDPSKVAADLRRLIEQTP